MEELFINGYLGWDVISIISILIMVSISFGKIPLMFYQRVGFIAIFTMLFLAGIRQVAITGAIILEFFNMESNFHVTTASISVGMLITFLMISIFEGRYNGQEEN